jgi:hypothetical protein
MKIAETSLAALLANRDYFENQAEHIAHVLAINPTGLTHNEIWAIIKPSYPKTIRPNVNARLSDLRMEGVAYVIGERVCTKSDERCNIWGLVPEMNRIAFRREALKSLINNLRDGIKDKTKKLEEAEKSLAATV